MNNEILPQYVKEYILAGKATVIFHNVDTSNQRKFIVYAEYKIKDNKNSGIIIWKVLSFEKSAKTGKRMLLGHIENTLDSVLHLTFTPFEFVQDRELCQNFSYIWHLIKNNAIPTNMKVLHLGQCSYCGRPLKDAISLDRGIGPICFNHLHPNHKL